MAVDYAPAKWVPADSTNYRVANRATFDCVIIHVTDGRARPEPVAEMWQEPHHGSSAHFVIGQDGAVIQCVPLKDVAWHAHAVNSHSVGIEHCARSPKELGPDDGGLPVSEEQYASSSKLVAWICSRYEIHPSRATILGHNEADSATTHADCPTGAGWDWTRFMTMVMAEYQKAAMVA